MAAVPQGAYPLNSGITETTGPVLVTIPTTAQVGWTAVVGITTNSGFPAPPSGSGWRELHIDFDTINSNQKVQHWVKDLVLADIGATYDFGSPTLARRVGILSLWSGTAADNVSITDPTTVTTAGTSHTSPAGTTTVNGTALLTFWALRIGSSPSPPFATVTVPGTETYEAESHDSISSSPHYTLQSTRRIQASAGAFAGMAATSIAGSTPPGTPVSATSIVRTVLLPPTSNGTGTPPVASFTMSPSTGVAPLTVAFTDTSTGSPTTRSWDFGDGGTSTATNPTHQFVSPGTYTVTLTVTNTSGTSTTTQTVDVTEPQATGGGLALYVNINGVLKPLTLYVNIIEEEVGTPVPDPSSPGVYAPVYPATY